MSLNSYFTSKFTKNISYSSAVQALIVRYQALFIIYINLFCIGIIFLCAIADNFFSVPGIQLILSIFPLSISSLICLKHGKMNISAAFLLVALHAANFLFSHVSNFVLGISQLILLMPGIGYFVSSSRVIHCLNLALCLIQNVGHIVKISSVFQVTLDDQQDFQIFMFKLLSFPILFQSFLIFFAQKSIESKLWQMAQSNYERAENITKELVEALEAKDVFVSSFSHEIRNPLNSLNGSIDYLVKVVKDPAHVQVLENAKLSGEVLLNLVSNVLDAAKMKSEKMELSYTESNPLDIIRKVLTINSAQLLHKRIFAQAFVDKNLPKKLSLDSSRILQIIMNLISNAIKFTFEGGRIQLHMVWCSLDKSQEELLQPIDSLNDTANYENESAFSDELARKIQEANNNQPSSISNIPAQFGTTLDSLCGSPANELASYEEFDTTTDSQSHFDNLKHLQGVKKTKGLSQVYSFHSRLNENFEILTPSNVGSKSLASLDDLSNAQDENKTETKGYLKVQITDTGCGIAEENLPKLFNMFSQADPNISRQYGGTGLGLWISKQLCQKMGGDISVYSKLDQGTTFVFYIEVDNNIPLQDIRTNRPKRFHDKVRAMVVDDYAYNRDLHKLILEREGVEVHLACDGKEAVHKYLSHEADFFDFIMMDIQMPELDGLSAAQQIRAFEAKNHFKNVDIYFVSGNYYANEAGILVENIPRTQFLRKPVSLDIIRKIVQTYGTLLKDPNNRNHHNSHKNQSKTSSDHHYHHIPNITFHHHHHHHKNHNETNRLTSHFPTTNLLAARPHLSASSSPAEHVNTNLDESKKKAILVVDYDSFNLFTVQLQLQQKNLEVLIAHNGQEALEIVNQKHEDIEAVLMDCEMPVMSGYESTEKIRELEKHEKKWKPLKIYGLTGHTGREHYIKCLEAGMSDVLTKPLNFKKIIDLIESTSS